MECTNSFEEDGEALKLSLIVGVTLCVFIVLREVLECSVLLLRVILELSVLLLSGRESKLETIVLTLLALNV